MPSRSRRRSPRRSRQAARRFRASQTNQQQLQELGQQIEALSIQTIPATPREAYEALPKIALAVEHMKKALEIAERENVSPAMQAEVGQVIEALINITLSLQLAAADATTVAAAAAC
jgi:hypothetical protein